MGLGILAAALAGLAAGESTPRTFVPLGGGSSIEDFSGAAAAGAKAGQQFSSAGMKTQAQQELDQQQIRRFTALKNNLDMHLLMQGVHRGDTQDFQSAVDSFSETLQNAQDLQDKGELLDPNTGKPMQLIRDGEYTNEQGLAMLQKGEIKSTQSQMIPSRVVQVPNNPSDPSQGMHPVMMYKILTDAGTGLGTVPLTDAMKKELGSKWDNAPVDTTKVPISLLLQNAHTRATSAQAGGTVSDWTRELQAVDPDNQKLKDFSYSAWAAQNPAAAKPMNQWLTAHKGMHVDEAIASLQKNNDLQNNPQLVAGFSKLQNDMGIKADSLTQMTTNRATAIAENKTPSYAEAIAIKNDPNASPALKTKAAGIIKDTDEAAINKENRINENKARAENDKQTQKDIRTHVYAMNNKGELVLSNYHESPGGEVVKDSDVMKDRGAMRQLDDVQMNNSMYKYAMSPSKPISAGDRDKLQELEALNQQNGGNLVSFGQGGVSLNIPVISAKLNKQNLKQMTDDLNALSPNARLRYAGYLRTAASVPAYAKAISGTARQNKETLELEMANIPKPYVDDATAKVQQDAWQDNITRAANGYPMYLPGMVHPNELRNQIDNPNGKGILVLLPTGQTAGPFANQQAANAFKTEAGI